MALGETADLLIRLNLENNLSRGLLGAQTSLKSLDSSFSNTQRSLATTATNLKRGGLIIGGALAGGFALAVREASNFEASLNTINTVAKVSDEQLAGIGDSLRALARDTGTSLDDLSASYYDLVSAGVDAADAQGVLTAANTLAIGGLATTSETVDLLTTAINAYGFEADKAADISDYFAQSIAAGKVTAAELAGSFSQVAPIAAAAGIEIEELAAGYAQLTAAGVPAAEASTQMRSAIVALQKPTADLEALQTKLGVNFADIAEEQGLAAAYQQIAAAAEDQGIELVTLTGRIEGASYALGVSGKNAATYNQNLEDVRTSTEGAGEAAAQAAERQKGLSYEFGKSKAIIRDVAIVFGTELLPGITNVVTKFNELLTLNYGKLEGAAKRIGDAFTDLTEGADFDKTFGDFTDKFGDLMDELGRADIKGIVQGALGFLRDMPWSTIAGGLKITGEAAKLLIDTFRSLPPDVQKVLIGAIALNKVTGGLVTSVVKDIGGLFFKALTTINAANVTVNAATMTGAPGGAAAGAGKAATIAKAIPVAVAGIVAIKLTDDLILTPKVQEIRDIARAEWPKMTAEQRNTTANLIDLQADVANLPVIRDLFAGTNAQLQALNAEFSGLATATNNVGGNIVDTLDKTSSAQQGELQRANNALAVLPFVAGQSSEQTAELGRINNATSVLPFVAGQTAEQAAESARLNNVVLPWATDRQVTAVKEGTDATRTQLQALGEKLDLNKNSVTSLKEVVSERLGVSIDQLRGILNHEETVAARLGISVEELRAIKGEAKGIASNVNASANEITREIAQWAKEQVRQLDRNHDGILTMKEVMADRLNVSIGELRDIETDEERAAERLGISVEQLRAIKADAQSTANDVNSINAKTSTTNERLSGIITAVRRIPGGGTAYSGGGGHTTRGDEPRRRQLGGQVDPYRPSLVGEQGEELFWPRLFGTILSHTKVEQLRASLTALQHTMRSYRPDWPGAPLAGGPRRDPVPVRVVSQPRIEVVLSARQVARELRREYEVSYARNR